VVTALDESTGASRLIADSPPDLVILCSGPRSRDSRIALCHELRERRGYAKVPILLASETVDEELIRRATEARVLTLAAPGGDDRKFVSAVQGVLEAARDH
jgi:DNA-binding NarL/FixJ family response regulator